MYNRAFISLFRQSLSKHPFSFSTQPKTTTSTPDLKEQPLKHEEIPTKPSKRQDSNEEEEDIPFQKENRNTVGWWIYRFFFWGGFSMLSYNIYLVYNHNKKTKVQDQFGAVPYVIDTAKEIVNNINDVTEFITQPPSKKLLADTVHPDFHPKTLILNLTGTIISSEYIFGKGNKITMRPGLANLLNRLVSKYEIIIFAEEDSAFIMNSIQSIDPKHQFIQGYFGKQSMVWRGGHYIKDMKYMNRDIRKIVVVDRNILNVKNQPDNVILLPQFSGQKDDIQLNKLLVLLQNLAGPEVVDVRKTLKNLGEKPVDSFYEKIKEKEKKLQDKQKSFQVFGSSGNNFKRKKEQQQY